MVKHKIEKKVKDFIEQYKMVNDQDKIIIGVSGGADSVCLLFALKKLRKELGFNFNVVHVNHGLRGESADRDEAFVKECCERLDVPCHIFHVNVKEVASREKLSIEDTGRMLRRQIFEKIMKETESSKVALAHHQNDNAETLLMNLARGSGLRGVSGIKPISEHYIRPLLCLTRDEIEEYLEEEGISFCVDETNEEIHFIRNRVRHVVIPHLEKVNSKAVIHMNETMNHLREIEMFMEKKVEEVFSQVVHGKDSSAHRPNHQGGQEIEKVESSEYCIQEKEFIIQPLVIQKVIIKKVMERVSGEKKDISRVHVDQALELFNKQVGRQINLPYGLVGVREYQGIVIATGSNDKVGKDISTSKEKREVAINIPGITEVPAYNMAIECRWIPKEERNFYQPSHSVYTKAIDYDIMKNGLFLRTREAGDRITVDRQGSRQKLKSYFINEKIPQSKRDNIPLLVDGKEVVWVIGYRMNMEYHISSDTKKILEIKVNHT